MSRTAAALLLVCVSTSAIADDAPSDVKPNHWVKISPRQDGPPSPGMGYEASFGYDPVAKVIIRWAGHNQGGGGEQNAETWTFDPVTTRWTLKEPGTSPPGVCCAQQNVFDVDRNRFLRFAGFSGNHGWQWFREIYLNNSAVWSYDLKENIWRDLRTVPAPRVASLRCASWDNDHQVAVIFGGEGSNEGTLVFDPYANSWTRRQPPRQPEPRSAGNMTYDAARKRHVLFGTQFSDDPHTWAYDLRKNEWLDLRPAVQPPTDRNDAVLAYDTQNQAVIASVRVIDKSDGKEVVDGHYETWAYDGADNTWKAMKPVSEPPGWGNRRRIMAYVPDLGAVVMENYINPSQRVPGVEREQQMWLYRFAADKKSATLLPPDGVSVSTSKDAVHLSWKAPASASAIVILRGQADQPWQADFQELARVSGKENTFRDAKVEPGKLYFYRLKSADSKGEIGNPSPIVRAQPRVVEDLIVSMASPKEARLSWKALPAKDIAGYHVERAPVEVFSEDEIARLKKDTPPLEEPSVGAVRAIGKFTRLTRAPVKETAFVDTTLDLSQPAAMDDKPLFVHRFGADRLDPGGKPYRYAVYAYRVIAVNALDVESGPSPYALTIPSAPHWLFSKEEGETCHLKWADNPEAKLQGYRVYRMESPRINGPGQKVTRLMEKPVAANRFSDPAAGKVTRRYWVVAVDALGQEGYPSAPTWHNREYRRYYVPFVGEWHQ